MEFDVSPLTPDEHSQDIIIGLFGALHSFKLLPNIPTSGSQYWLTFGPPQPSSGFTMIQQVHLIGDNYES